METVTTKVTRMKGHGYGVRVWASGRLWADIVVPTRKDVGPAIAEELRMLAKCGSKSPMAHASRARHVRT